MYKLCWPAPGCRKLPFVIQNVQMDEEQIAIQLNAWTVLLVCMAQMEFVIIVVVVNGKIIPDSLHVMTVQQIKVLVQQVVVRLQVVVVIVPHRQSSRLLVKLAKIAIMDCTLIVQDVTRTPRVIKKGLRHCTGMGSIRPPAAGTRMPTMRGIKQDTGWMLIVNRKDNS